MSENHRVRRSQYISPYGVGAIYDVGMESFVATDITKWSSNSGDVIHLRRLESRLRINEFRMPPVNSNRWGTSGKFVEYLRFPSWMFCPSCRSMTRLDPGQESGEAPLCKNCRGKKVLVPMRFVSACEAGHMEDVDWHWWAHSRLDVADKGRCEDRSSLKFKTLHGRGSGLASLEVRCEECGSSRTLEGITAPGAVKKKCNGRQPWQRFGSDTGQQCDKTPRVLQRGASNLYYPKVVSALDIPAGSNLADESVDDLKKNIRGHAIYERTFNKMQNSTGVVVEMFAGEIASDLECELDFVLSVLKEDVQGQSNDGETAQRPPAYDESEILEEEWPFLVNPPKDASSDVFHGESFNLKEYSKCFGLDSLIDRLVVIHKLREVRALRGFHRINPGDDEGMVPVDLGKSQGWLPAIEVFGEGIFISINESKICAWEKEHRAEIKTRLERMQKNYLEAGLSYFPAPTARLVMLHTLSHMLIRQLSFECGYSASSLRERIYSSTDDSECSMAGILIYTADADSEGSLGGLAREGNPDRFIPTMLTAMERSSWCSTDPICRESHGQGMRGLNMAACHACSLVSETSCIYGNVMLDRMLLIGGGESGGKYGFFSEVLDM